MVFRSQCRFAITHSVRLHSRHCCSENPKSYKYEVVDEELQSFAIEKAKLIQQFEKEYLHKLLGETGGNISRAATIAKKERRAFSRLMQKHGLDRKTYV